MHIMKNLPRDVLLEIFTQFLAKELAQMRCVCKSWNAFLSESSFIKSHLHRSIHKNDATDLLFFPLRFSFDHSPFTAHPSRSPEVKLTNFIKRLVNTRIKSSYQRGGRVIGSVNGLLCFHHGSDHEFVISIWNLSLSAVLTLPPCSLRSSSPGRDYFRFGFDPKTDDYKIVKLRNVSKPRCMVSQGEIYSMKKGSWELISQRFPSQVPIIFEEDAVCVDGHDGRLHWLGYTCLVAFDLGAETFHEIPLPDSILHHCGYYCLNVFGVLGGKVCVMSCIEGGKFEVWVMNEYGVAKSWVKHHVFSQFTNIIPIGFTLHNEFLFRENIGRARVHLYDPVAAKTKTFETKGGFGDCKIVEYVDSLAWVSPSKHEQSISRFQF